MLYSCEDILPFLGWTKNNTFGVSYSQNTNFPLLFSLAVIIHSILFYIPVAGSKITGKYDSKRSFTFVC
jgi:hypothetical protein